MFLPMLAMLAVFGFLAVSVVDPYTGAYAGMGDEERPTRSAQPGQTLELAATDAVTVSREVWKVTKPKPKPVAAAAGRAAPAAGTPDPGTAKAIAYDMVMARGWDQGQYDCLVALWHKESKWNVYAHNKSSGAYGIPQSLPGSKMATAGADWETNPATQITWGLGYISGRYGTPCGAWAKSQSSGWY
ncbi:lytic transglycosylase domain-containing protein [Diaminobutyricimonas sp. LJ205]|uniref:aggregation-promoting factor C-terminal-like domain-containing protein n=1 Tax=Diaminobutyricimonas sp. LJ205 TaxID=2683590 RepID=UPI001E395274|nr:lytic transglycosylase domain-containing protein [Diaminobutyricimonas sp. LJ205]